MVNAYFTVNNKLIVVKMTEEMSKHFLMMRFAIIGLVKDGRRERQWNRMQKMLFE